MATTTLDHSTATEHKAQATTMQAITQDQYGSTDVLKLQQDVKPAVGLDDARVQVRAARSSDASTRDVGVDEGR
jgi:hypothetical protein